MSLNRETDHVVTLRPDLDRNGEARLDPIAPELAPVPLPAPDQLAPVIRTRGRSGWVVPAAVGAAGLIASAALGGILWSTTGQRDAAVQQLKVTRATLSGTQQQLSTATADAATRKVTADYVTFYVVDSGRVLTDYEAIIACNAYSDCRTAAQQALGDMQAFQADRAAATVPPALADANGMLGDGLSAAIAADQELISGMDNNSLPKIKDGGHKFDAAMLAISKAETALGAGLR